MIPTYTVTVGRDTLDYNWENDWGNIFVIDTVNVPSYGYYVYSRTYDWSKYGSEYVYNDTLFSAPNFSSVFNATIQEIKSMNNLEYMFVSIYWSGYLNAGINYPNDNINWYYILEIPDYAIYVPIITWDADDFDAWIFPDPTFNGILPGVTTDTEFKRIFGITAEDWQKTIRLEFD